MTAIAAFELPIKITVNVISDGLEKSENSLRYVPSDGLHPTQC